MIKPELELLKPVLCMRCAYYGLLILPLNQPELRVIANHFLTAVPSHFSPLSLSHEKSRAHTHVLSATVYQGFR